MILLSVFVESFLGLIEHFRLGTAKVRHAAQAVLYLGFAVASPFALPQGANPVFAQPEDWYTKAQYEAASWLSQNTDPKARIAAFQSGIFGYFSERHVVNLDGVVNPSALPYYLEGDIVSYLRKERIDYLVDWDGFVDQVDLKSVQAELVQVFTRGNRVKIVRLIWQEDAQDGLEGNHLRFPNTMAEGVELYAELHCD